MHIYTTYSYRDNYGVANSESCPGNSAMTKALFPALRFHSYICATTIQNYTPILVRESVDSLCRDSANAQYMQKPYHTRIAMLQT